jgi:hypothetical protein
MGFRDYRFTGLPPNATFSADDGLFRLLNKVPGKDCVSAATATGEEKEGEREEEHMLTIDTAGMLLRFPVGM